MRKTWVQSLGWEDLLEKEMATHSSILAWKFQWTEEPGRLQLMRLQRIGHDWVTSLLRWFECIEVMRTDDLEHFQSSLSPQFTFPPSFVDRRVAFMERTLDSGRRGPALGMWGLAVALLSVLLSIIHRVRRSDLWGPASPFCTALQVPRLLNWLSRWLQVCFWGPWGLLPGARHIVVLCLFRASRNSHSGRVVGAQTLALDVHGHEHRAPWWAVLRDWG